MTDTDDAAPSPRSARHARGAGHAPRRSAAARRAGNGAGQDAAPRPAAEGRAAHDARAARGRDDPAQAAREADDEPPARGPPPGARARTPACWSCSGRPATSPTARSCRRSTSCGGRTFCPTSSSCCASADAPLHVAGTPRRVPGVAREVLAGPAARRGCVARRSRRGSPTSSSTSPTPPRSTTSPLHLEEIDRRAQQRRQPPLLPGDPAVGVRRDRGPARPGRARPRDATTAAGDGSSSRSRSATTSSRRSG